MPMIAGNLNEIDITLESKALNEDNYESYYVATQEARGGEDPISEISRKIKNLENKNLKVLFSGFKGCGKSTELLRLQKALKEDFVALSACPGIDSPSVPSYRYSVPNT